MGIYTDAIQKLYVAYFSRPADVAGLAYWENVVAANKGSTTAVSAAFAASAEYKAAFAGLDAYHIVDQVYVNLFGRHAEPTGLNYWGQLLLTNKLTVDAIVTAVAGGAQGTDAVAYSSKVAGATAFTNALDLSYEILGYANPSANAGAANFIAGITDAATLAAAIAPATLDATVLAITTPQPIGTTYALTGTVDTLVGTNANDTFNATGTTLSTFDSINGSAGNDTLNIVDTGTAAGTAFVVNSAGATIAGVETIQVLTTGGATVDTTAMTGATKLTVTAVGTAAVMATAGAATDVTVTSAAAAGAGVTVAGGKAVTVTSSAATAGNTSVSGAGLTAVIVNGGANVVIDNGVKGTTLTQASVFGATGSSMTLTGTALTNVSLSNIMQADAVTVNNTKASHDLNLSLSSVGYDAGGLAVAVSVADAVATTANINAVTKSAVTLTGAKIATANLTGGALALNAGGAGNVKLTTINGAAATGALTLSNLGNGVNTVTTGTGNDTVAFNALTASGVTNASVSTGAGNDTITLTTTGDGIVTVSTGDGDDTVILTSRGVADVLNIDLGAGTDTLNAAVAINSGDTVNGGAGSDTLALNLVGSANIGAFSGFELFDTIALNKTLDVDILASKNTVTEIIASGAVGAAVLQNVGAGVGVRATGDMVGSTLTVTQKVAGALTITADMDEATAADTAIDTFAASITATNATSANIVFATDYLAKIAGEIALGDNATTLNVSTGAATSATVVSGGTLSVNTLNYTDSSLLGNKLASLTVTGTQALTLNTTTTGALATVDASAQTGGLTFSTTSLANGGKVILGSGVDKITVNVATSITTGAEQISGFEKTLAVAVTTDPLLAADQAAAIADADVMVIAGGTVANANTVAILQGAGAVTAKGVLTFTGAGPATLADAFLIADAAADAVGEVLVFNYLGDSYVFMQNGATDVAVKLVGVIGITNIAEVGATDAFFIV